jgi:hypothetical protein
MVGYAFGEPTLRTDLVPHFAALMRATVLLFIDASIRFRPFVMAGLRPGHPRLSCLKPIG